MAEQGPEEPTIQPISRFSTSTSLRLTAAQEQNAMVVPMPKWSNIIGFARVVLAVLVLAFTAAAAAIWGGYAAFGVALFTASATLLIFAYYIVALSSKPLWYNRWAVLSLEIFGVIFWLVSFSLLADWTSWYNGDDYWYGDGDSYGFWKAPYSPQDVGFSKRAKVGKSQHSKYHAGVALAGTAAGLGAVEFVLYSVTLVIFGLALHKQRMGVQVKPVTHTRPAEPSVPETNEVKDSTGSRTEVANKTA